MDNQQNQQNKQKPVISQEKQALEALKRIRGFDASQSWTVEALCKTIHKIIDDVIPLQIKTGE